MKNKKNPAQFAAGWELPKKIKEVLALSNVIDEKKFDVRGSVGGTRKTYYPWTVILDKDSSEDVRHGFYVALIFNKSMTGIYMLLCQGAYYFTNDLHLGKSGGCEAMARIAEAIRSRSNPGEFIPNKPDLGTELDAGEQYASSTVCYKYFQRGKIEEKGFINSLISMIHVFVETRKMFGKSGYFDFVQKVLSGSAIEEKMENVVNLTESMSAENPALTSTKKKLFENNIILFGAPGTGKTFISRNYAVSICDNTPLADTDDEDFEKSKQKRKDLNARYQELVRQGRIEFVTFHQSYSYEDFVLGIFPDLTAGALSYRPKSGVFKKLCDRAKGENENYVIVIDEINRGNISKIFGELITLVEDSKRLGADEEIVARLPLKDEDGNDTFGVPQNVYIIGTMNTADRSIQHVDTALRRRFVFKEMTPNIELLKRINIGEINVGEMVDALNNRITRYFDREHVIGHSYFVPLLDEKKFTNKDERIDELGHIFHDCIIPLLQDYFFDDYEKSKKVLGEFENEEDDFIRFESSKNNIDDDDAINDVYTIRGLEKDSPFFKEEKYLKIYKEK